MSVAIVFLYDKFLYDKGISDNLFSYFFFCEEASLNEIFVFHEKLSNLAQL